MSEILILLAIVAVIVILGAVVVWRTRNKVRHEPDYKGFFWIGLVWVIAGAVFMLMGHFAMNGLFAMGVIFLAIGAANRNRWKKKRTIPPGQKWLTLMGVFILLIGIAVMALLVYV